jgi:hypothetical protein
MKKPANIYVVMRSKGDGYHLICEEPIAWFFDKQEAEDWAEVRRDAKGYVDYDVEVVAGGTWK